MKYISTRNNSKEHSFEEVFIKGLADDGGLFIPKEIKKYTQEELNSLSELSYQDLAKKIIYPFIGDFMSESELSLIIDKSYSTFRKKNVVDLIKLGHLQQGIFVLRKTKFNCLTTANFDVFRIFM